MGSRGCEDVFSCRRGGHRIRISRLARRKW
jgi:hypothetical protein